MWWNAPVLAGFSITHTHRSAYIHRRKKGSIRAEQNGYDGKHKSPFELSILFSLRANSADKTMCCGRNTSGQHWPRQSNAFSAWQWFVWSEREFCLRIKNWDGEERTRMIDHVFDLIGVHWLDHLLCVLLLFFIRRRFDKVQIESLHYPERYHAFSLCILFVITITMDNRDAAAARVKCQLNYRVSDWFSIVQLEAIN